MKKKTLVIDLDKFQEQIAKANFQRAGGKLLCVNILLKSQLDSPVQSQEPATKPAGKPNYEAMWEELWDYANDPKQPVSGVLNAHHLLLTNNMLEIEAKHTPQGDQPGEGK